MENIPFITDQFINEHTSYPELVARLEKAFGSDSVLVPQRHHHDFPNPNEGVDSTLLLMPAWDPGKNAGIKIVNVSPNNQKYNLPSIQGVYLLMDAQKGSLKAIFDAKELTNKRTAAASALASSYLSRETSSSMLMIGTGALCRNLIAAHASVRPIEKVFVYGRSTNKARAIASELTTEALKVEPISSIEEVISEVDIVSCATLTKIPLVFGEYLRPGQHLDMVGAYKKDMREADNKALLRASIFVDNFTGALKETGDLVIPLAEGVIQEEDVKGDLFGLCSGQAQGRTSSDQITFFKSVGHALEDLIGANYYFDQYK